MPDDIGICEHLSELVPMSRKQLRMLLFDVALTFLGQFDLTIESRAEKASHPSCIA